MSPRRVGTGRVGDLASRNGTRLNGVAVKASARRVVRVGDVITFGSDAESWCVRDDSPPSSRESIGQTAKSAIEIAALHVEFVVSADEEDVTLNLENPPHRLDTSRRAFNYLLLTLARARIEDRAGCESEAEHGWVHIDELVPALYPDVETLNVNIHRARKYLSELGIVGADRIVERRTASRRIRLGIGDVAVVHSRTQRLA